MTYQEAYARLHDVRYVLGGRDEERDGGLDCWGYIRRFYELAGLGVPPLHLVDTDDGMFREFSTFPETEWRDTGRPKEFSVVLFRYQRDGKTRHHCGIVCPDCATFTHLGRDGVRRDSLYRDFWREHTVGYYEYMGAKI